MILHWALCVSCSSLSSEYALHFRIRTFFSFLPKERCHPYLLDAPLDYLLETFSPIYLAHDLKNPKFIWLCNQIWNHNFLGNQSKYGTFDPNVQDIYKYCKWSECQGIERGFLVSISIFSLLSPICFCLLHHTHSLCKWSVFKIPLMGL